MWRWLGRGVLVNKWFSNHDKLQYVIKKNSRRSWHMVLKPSFPVDVCWAFRIVVSLLIPSVGWTKFGGLVGRSPVVRRWRDMLPMKLACCDTPIGYHCWLVECQRDIWHQSLGLLIHPHHLKWKRCVHLAKCPALHFNTRITFHSSEHASIQMFWCI